ncbi:MAG: hypothetical protein ACN6I4_00250 [bacterium]
MSLLKLIIISFLFLLSVFGKAQNNFLAGKWLSVNDGDSSFLIFTKDFTYIIDEPSESIYYGGLNAYSEDDAIFLDHRYTLDTSVLPHKFTLTAYIANTDSFFFMIPAIFELRGDNTLACVFANAIFKEDGNLKELINKFYAKAIIGAEVDDEDYETYIFKFLK